jgi:hypothetical protein
MDDAGVRDSVPVGVRAVVATGLDVSSTCGGKALAESSTVRANGSGKCATASVAVMNAFRGRSCVARPPGMNPSVLAALPSSDLSSPMDFFRDEGREEGRIVAYVSDNHCVMRD